ncbi:MAG: cell division protein ZapA [Myxococcota bacterium]|nr:cell division protein ZapA [Myxococcota bacterium]
MSVSDPTTRQTIEVTILGQRMLLKAEEDSKHIERLASYVNRKVDEVSGGGSVATTKLAILAALNIANDYFRELDQSNEFKQWVAEKSRSLLAELDSSDSDEMPEQGLG